MLETYVQRRETRNSYMNGLATIGAKQARGYDAWRAELMSQIEKLKREAELDRLEAYRWSMKARELRRRRLFGFLLGSSAAADEAAVNETEREEAIFLEAAKYHGERCLVKLAAVEVHATALRRLAGQLAMPRRAVAGAH